jgi:hypothetical protein
MVNVTKPNFDQNPRMSGESTMQDHEEHLFYDRHIYRHREQKYIQKILAKYKKEPASDTLKEKIWNELMWEKHQGNLHIPFKVVMRRDPYNRFTPFIEVILDTKL